MEALSDKMTRIRQTLSTRRPTVNVAGVAEQRLKGSAYSDLRSVTCEFRDGVVTLSGRVPTFYLKQVAQTVVGKIEQVEQVINNLDVSGDMSQSRRSFWIHTE